MIHLKVCTLKKCLVPPKSNPWGYMYPQINLLVGMLLLKLPPTLKNNSVYVIFITISLRYPKIKPSPFSCFKVPKEHPLRHLEGEIFPHHHHHIRFRARFPLPRVGLFDKSSSKTSSPLRAILRVSRVHI